MATIKKAQKGVKVTADSTSYFKKKADSLNTSAGSKYLKEDFKGGKKDSDKSIKALYDEYRQSEKGRPGKDANGFPVKKAKNGKWMQKVSKSIKARGTKGVCTGKKFGGPTCKPGSKRYNLAKVFKGMAKKKK